MWPTSCLKPKCAIFPTYQGRIQKIQKEGAESPTFVFVMQSKVMLTFWNMESKSIL